jgi:hypothetical protein
MIDYTFLFFLIFFMLWLYFIDLSLSRKEIGITYLQFGLVIPLTIYLADNVYISGFLFGWLFVFIPILCSIIILATNFNDIKKKKG